MIKQKDFSEKLQKLAETFNDNAEPYIVPTKPDKRNEPLSLPPTNLKGFATQTTTEEVVADRKSAIAEPSLTKQNPTETQPNPSLTKENIEESIEEIGQQEPQVALEQPTKRECLVQAPTKRGRGRPKGSLNKKTLEKQKAEHSIGALNVKKGEKLSQARLASSEKLSRKRESEKLSQLQHNYGEMLPVDVCASPQKLRIGKTSLAYVLLYSRELTPIEIELLLEKQNDLNLTASEIIALDLVKRTINHDQKAEKIYWDLMKNGEKNQKITPIKTETTLLDEALEKAENAIFGEVVDNPEQA